MSKLTDFELHTLYTKSFSDKSAEGIVTACVAALRAIEAAATEPLLQRIAELEENEKVLLAQVQGHTQWREKIVKASEQAYGENAIRYKFSLTKSGKCMNEFPKEIDGRWFALVPAEDDGHIGHIARIAELERQLEEARNEAESYRWLKERDRWAAVMVDFDRDGTYRRHRVVWYSRGEWLSSDGQSIEEAIAAAMQKGQS